MLRHDVRTDGFPAGSFDLVPVRAVLMHIADRMTAHGGWHPGWRGGWLVVEDADFGMWLAAARSSDAPSCTAARRARALTPSGRAPR